jgi:hypothetical protein
MKSGKGRRFSRSQKVAVAFSIAGLAMIGLFQNCGSGFAVDPNFGGTTQLSSEMTALKVGVSAQDYRICLSGTEPIYDCLEAKSAVKGQLKAEDVTRCTSGTPTPSQLDSAMCLTRTGFPIFNYREPLQWDLSRCATSFGTNRIAVCLERNGILPKDLSQAKIEECIGAVGLDNLEKCLRKNAFLAKNPFPTNADAALCGKVTEQGTNSIVIRDCLLNREVIPATVTQESLDTCMTAAPTMIARCLRTNRIVPRIIMQANINVCVNAVGPNRVAACLEANGYLYDSLLPATTLQTTIDQCNETVGPNNIARCLRTRNILERSIMQGHITSCAALVGNDRIYNCLAANGLVDVNGTAANSIAGQVLAQSDIDACVTNVGVGSVARCLVGARGKLVANPHQPTFAACHRFHDPAGVAACLDGSGMLPTGLTQANIDTCLSTAGLAGLETCLRTSGFISYPAVP